MRLADRCYATEEELRAFTRLSALALSSNISTLKHLGFIRKYTASDAHGKTCTVLGVSHYFLLQWLIANRQKLQQEERSDMMLDPALRVWAIEVLTNASAFLFSEAKEILERRREWQRSADEETEHKTVQGSLAGTEAVAETPDREKRQAWVEQIIHQVDIAKREENIRDIETLVRQIREYQRTRRTIEELLAEGGVEASGMIALRTRLDKVKEQIMERKEELRVLWEKVCGTSAEPSA